MAVLRVAGLALLIVLAGCTAKPAQEPEIAPNLSVGAIAGVTVTPTIEPIAGARLALDPVAAAAKSDMFGRFQFQDIPPGSYRLVAQADGHQAITLTVDVAAGQTARPRLVLPLLDLPEARHETVEFQGYFPAGLGPAHSTGAAQTVFGECTCRFAIATGPTTVAIVVEAVWNDNLERPDEPTRLRWEAHLANGTLAGNGTSPLHAVVAGDMGEGFFLDILPDAAWPALDQGFQLFVTRWDVDAPPDGWSRVRGDP